MFGSDIQYSTYLTIIGIISRSEMDHLVERRTTAPMAERPVALSPVFARCLCKDEGVVFPPRNGGNPDNTPADRIAQWRKQKTSVALTIAPRPSCFPPAAAGGIGPWVTGALPKPRKPSDLRSRSCRRNSCSERTSKWRKRGSTAMESAVCTSMPNIRWRAGWYPPVDELESGCSVWLTDPSFDPTIFHPGFRFVLPRRPLALGLLSSHPQTRFVGPRDAFARSQVLAHTARSR